MKANELTQTYEGEAPANSREARILLRRSIGNLWESKPVSLKQVIEAKRVGTWTVCDVCGMFYADHPKESRHLGSQKYLDDLLTQMCDGVTLVKL